IIPTEERVHLSDLSADERKLYDIIVKRFLSLFYEPYKYETIHAVINVNKETFIARETAVIDMGFKKITGNTEEKSKNQLASLQHGKNFTVQS
ncbi:DNA topoisomerase III, partial [Pseudomonas sp. MPR-R5A]